jgi:hypothetical protein
MNVHRRDDLFCRLEALKPLEATDLQNDKERNRALKFARERGLFFVSRQHKGKLKLWRLPEQ